MKKAGYSLVTRSQPGVVRIRIILAQINANSSVYTQTDDLITQGLKPGQAVVEAEILSLDGQQQLGALHHGADFGHELLKAMFFEVMIKIWGIACGSSKGQINRLFGE